MYKILGGASFYGRNMDQIVELGEDIKTNMGTISVSMNSDSPAGYALKNSGGFKEIELGRGLEGELPKDTFNWIECDNLMSLLIQRFKRKPELLEGLKTVGSEWIVMVNNLGGVTEMEMNLIIYSLVKQFRQAKLKILRLVHGSLMRALDLNGITVTILRADVKRKDEIL